MVERANLMFENEIDAATKLMEILPLNFLKKDKYCIVCSSLDSIVLANHVAKELKLDYEILFCERIFSPINPECTIACVSETQEIVIIDELIRSFGISLDYVYGQANRKYEEKILKNVYKYRKGELLRNLENKNIILLDDGCESGLTALTCIKSLINIGAKTITYATPLIAKDVADKLRILVDEIYCVHKIVDFVDVNFYYKEKFENTTEAIIEILENSPFYLPFKSQTNKEKQSAVQN